MKLGHTTLNSQPVAVALLLAGIAVLAGSACGPRLARFAQEGIRRRIKFEEYTYFHNVGITWDGRNYYTVNGGNPDYGKIGVFLRDGTRLSTARVKFDGRAIFYCPKDRHIYLKGYSTDLYRYDPASEEVKVKATGVFHSDQSSPALSPDGGTLYELADGTLYIMDFPSMKVRDEIRDFVDEELDVPYNSTIACSQDYLFTWDEDGTVKVYDRAGSAVTEFQLRTGLHGMSLTWANGLLWGAEDADGKTGGGTGYWYGFDLGPGIR